MKRTLFLLLITITTFTACKKDPQEKLKGRWDQTKVHLEYISNGTKTEDNITHKIGEVYIVFNGNTYKSYQDGELESSGSFTATENSITLTKGDSKITAALRWSSKKEIVMIYEINDAPSLTAKAEATYKKH